MHNHYVGVRYSVFLFSLIRTICKNRQVIKIWLQLFIKRNLPLRSFSVLKISFKTERVKNDINKLTNIFCEEYLKLYFRILVFSSTVIYTDSFQNTCFNKRSNIAVGANLWVAINMSKKIISSSYTRNKKHSLKQLVSMMYTLGKDFFAAAAAFKGLWDVSLQTD